MREEPKNAVLLIFFRCKVGHRSEIFVSIFLAPSSVLNGQSFGFLLLTWSLSDVSRFQLYAIRSLGLEPPEFLRSVRYSDFLVQYPLVMVSELLFVGCVHFPDHLGPLFFACAFIVVAAILSPDDFVGHFYRRTSSWRWLILLVAIFWAGGIMRVCLTCSYALCALFFQVYEWVIFVPAYQKLWNIRQRRLSPLGLESVCSAIGVPSGFRIAPIGPEGDNVVKRHWKMLWLERLEGDEAGLLPDFDEKTQAFIDRARRLLKYQTLVAYSNEGKIVGSVSAQIFEVRRRKKN